MIRLTDAYWLLWTAVVILSALSARPAQFELWLISPYMWWIAPLALWATAPRDRTAVLGCVWISVIFGWVAWRCLWIGFQAFAPWTPLPTGSTGWAAFNILKVALIAALVALAYRRPLRDLYGELGPRAACAIGMFAGFMHYHERLLDLEVWQQMPGVNLARVANCVLFAWVLAQSQLWYGPGRTPIPERQGRSALPPRPKIIGFFGLLVVTVVGSGWFVLYYYEFYDDPPTALWKGLAFGIAPVVLASWSGARAWKRLRGEAVPLTRVATLRKHTGRAAILALLVPPWLLTLWLTVPAVGESAVESIRMAAGPPWSIELDEDQAKLIVRGEIFYGYGDSVVEALRANPSVTTLAVSSPGGLIFEADKVVQEVRARGLKVVVWNRCSSACTQILLAGAERELEHGSRVGFHAATNLGLPTPGAINENREQLLAAGFSEALADEHGATAAWDMWYPTEEQLLAAGVIMRVVQTPDDAE